MRNVGLIARAQQLTRWIYSKVYASFGGLLMALEGPDHKLTPLRVDHVYLLIRR